MNTQQLIDIAPHHPLIQTNIPLADKNWFQTGGNARFFAEPKTADEFAQALTFAEMHNLELVIIGQGANMLISDDGFDGLVIRPQLTDTIAHPSETDDVLVTAGAGVTMPGLIEWCLDNNIIGLEEFSGIPGTVGGSVYINLHYFQFLLAQFLVSARVINRHTKEVSTVDTAWFEFGYNQSKLLAKEYFLVDATFQLKKVTDVETAFARGRRIEIIRHRTARYPSTHTCGSFFRNFHPHEVTMTSNGKQLIWVAYYLDKVGIKGTLQVGGAIVSHQHANMLVNKGTATSTDIINLARAMQELVHAEFGITPQPECQLVGFKEYPLL